MASIVADLIQSYEEGKVNRDPHSQHWFLLNNDPVPIWVITVLYLLIIWLGPKYMRDKQPLKLQWFLVLYNMGCVALSLYMAIEITLVAIEKPYDVICAPYNKETRWEPIEYRMKCVLYWYFFSKLVELMDTVLMVVRKKNNQITFLHVLHHASMLNIWWWVMMYIPSGLCYFGALMNCWVHVVMYSYYGLSAIPSLREKLWWKKYITRFQLLQFVITFSHSVNSIRLGCDFPEWGKYLLSGYMIIMFTLFSNFYFKSYLSPKSRQGKRDAGAKNGPITNGQSSTSSSKRNGSFQNGRQHGDANGHTISDKKLD